MANPLPDLLPSAEQDLEALVGIARGIKASAWTELTSDTSGQRHVETMPPYASIKAKITY